jgi:hypothetical protein
MGKNVMLLANPKNPTFKKKLCTFPPGQKKKYMGMNSTSITASTDGTQTFINYYINFETSRLY